MIEAETARTTTLSNRSNRIEKKMFCFVYNHYLLQTEYTTVFPIDHSYLTFCQVKQNYFNRSI